VKGDGNYETLALGDFMDDVQQCAFDFLRCVSCPGAGVVFGDAE
jgi:hypothetical protein